MSLENKDQTSQRISYMKYATGNEEQLKACGTFACVYCRHIGPVSSIDNFTSENDGKLTALCPECYVDAVIPRNCLPDDEAYCIKKLTEYHREGFGTDSDYSDSD